MTKKEFVFLGPPASGKGTQTTLISQASGLVHVDTGSLLRAEMANGTPEGIEAKTNIEKGQLVDASLVARMIQKRLMQPDCANGFILDGYPRSIEQAEYLNEIKKEIDGDSSDIDFRVFYFDLPMDVLMERIIYRRSCPKCGKIFNLKFLPSPCGDKCCECNEPLIQRKDDTEEIAKARFETYFNETAPLVKYYEEKGVLEKIDALGEIDEVYTRLTEAINKK